MWNPKGFGRLVLDDNMKELLYAVGYTYKPAGKTLSDGFAPFRDTGFFMLLHGYPGTGKTLTAERFVPRHCLQNFPANLLTGHPQLRRDCR